MLCFTSAIEDRRIASARQLCTSLPLEVPRSSIPFPPAGRASTGSSDDRPRPYGMAPVPPPGPPTVAGAQNEDERSSDRRRERLATGRATGREATMPQSPRHEPGHGGEVK